jgi:hypothetical protein
MDQRSEGGPGQPQKQNSTLLPSGYAPWYNVPNKPVVSIEHPYIIKNIDKGLDTLGDTNQLQAVSRSIILFSEHSAHDSSVASRQQ